MRSARRNRIHAAISILGLAFGIAAALIAALVVRAEYNYDSFNPARDRTYLAAIGMAPPGATPMLADVTHHSMPTVLKENIPQIEATARLATTRVTMRKGDIQATERLSWADPSAFDVLPVPVLAGDLRSALSRPDGIVLTRTISQKYFGADTALGAQLPKRSRQSTRCGSARCPAWRRLVAS